MWSSVWHRLQRVGGDLSGVDRLVQEQAILRTMHEYGHALDYGDEQLIADVFCEDGVFDVRMTDGSPVHIERGRQEMVEYARGYPKPPEVHTKHLLHSPVITVDGDRATAVAYFSALRERDGVPYLMAFGRYRDELVRESRWRIKHRFAEVEARELRAGDAIAAPDGSRAEPST